MNTSIVPTIDRAELIPVTEREGRSAVSGRDLHEFLDVSTPYMKWFSRMVEYGFIEGQDYADIFVPVPSGRSDRAYRQTDHALTLDMAKELSMIQRTDKGKQARQYFIEVEKRARNQTPVALTRSDLARMVLESESAREIAESRARELEPAAEAWGVMVSASGDYSVDEAAKILSRDPSIEIGRTRLFSHMSDLGWLFRSGKRQRWHAYQSQVDNGRLTMRMSAAFLNARTGEMENPAPTIRITAHGVEKLRATLKEAIAA